MTATIHSISLRIRAIDYQRRAALEPPSTDESVRLSIIARMLHIACECPTERLYHLFDMWNQESEGHPIHAQAVGRLLEILDETLDELEPA